MYGVSSSLVGGEGERGGPGWEIAPVARAGPRAKSVAARLLYGMRAGSDTVSESRETETGNEAGRVLSTQRWVR